MVLSQLNYCGTKLAILGSDGLLSIWSSAPGKPAKLIQKVRIICMILVIDKLLWSVHHKLSSLRCSLVFAVVSWSWEQWQGSAGSGHRGWQCVCLLQQSHQASSGQDSVWEGAEFLLEQQQCSLHWVWQWQCSHPAAGIIWLQHLHHLPAPAPHSCHKSRGPRASAGHWIKEHCVVGLEEEEHRQDSDWSRQLCLANILWQEWILAPVEVDTEILFC